jgi:GT2 family glycosyltransferase
MSKLQEVGGFDEDLRIDYNDIYLCLKLGEKGYRIVYTPHAELYHFERSSSSRDVTDPADTVRFLARWSELLKRDTYMNPSFVRNNNKSTDNYSLLT